MDALLGSTHTAEICTATGRPVSASTTRASGQLTTTLTTDVRSCSVGLKMISDLKQRQSIINTKSVYQNSQKIQVKSNLCKTDTTLKWCILNKYRWSKRNPNHVSHYKLYKYRFISAELSRRLFSYKTNNNFNNNRFTWIRPLVPISPASLPGFITERERRLLRQSILHGDHIILKKQNTGHWYDWLLSIYWQVYDCCFIICIEQLKEKQKDRWGQTSPSAGRGWRGRDGTRSCPSEAASGRSSAAPGAGSGWSETICTIKVQTSWVKHSELRDKNLIKNLNSGQT